MRILIVVLILGLFLWNAPAVQAESTFSVREKVRAIERGSYVELKQRVEPKTLRGQLTDATDDGVVLHVVVDCNEEMVKTIPYEQIKAIKPLSGPMKKTFGQRLLTGVLSFAYLFTYVAEP